MAIFNFGEVLTNTLLKKQGLDEQKRQFDSDTAFKNRQLGLLEQYRNTQLANDRRQIELAEQNQKRLYEKDVRDFFQTEKENKQFKENFALNKQSALDKLKMHDQDVAVELKRINAQREARIKPVKFDSDTTDLIQQTTNPEIYHEWKNYTPQQRYDFIRHQDDLIQKKILSGNALSAVTNANIREADRLTADDIDDIITQGEGHFSKREILELKAYRNVLSGYQSRFSIKSQAGQDKLDSGYTYKSG